MGYDGANRAQLRTALEANGLRPNKRLGQNFLCDPNAADAIVRAAGDLHARDVLEIGPGAGALTVRLCQKAQRVSALELDAGLFALLTHELAHCANLTLVHGDALKAPLHTMIQTPDAAVVANLPYYATTAILLRLLHECKCANTFVLMMQKEVAARLCAPPGNKSYGSLSVAVQYYAQAQTVMQVPPSCFFPAPEVDSTVVRLTRRAYPQRPMDETWMFDVVRASFQMRRKTLFNNLCAMPQMDKQGVTHALQKCGIDPAVRGERLNIDAFIALSDAMLPDKRG